MAYTKEHAQQNKIMLAKALEVVAQHYELERDKNRLDFEYHDNLQRAVFAALEQELDVSTERKRQLHAKALRQHRGLMKSHRYP